MAVFFVPILPVAPAQFLILSHFGENTVMVCKEDTMATAKYKRGKDGYFQARVWDGTYTEDGRKKRISLRSKKSSRDLENMVKEMEQKVQERKYVRQSDICIQEYARKWLSVYKAGTELNTRTMYLNIIEKHLDVLDKIKLSDITKLHVLLVINNANGKNRTQEQILLTLKQVVNAAVADKLLPASAPDELFRDIVIKKIRTEKRALCESEKKAVFTADLADMDKAFLYLIYGCGLRRGEALALTRFDFNLKAKTLNVNKSLAFNGNDPYLKSTKNQVERVVPIPSNVFSFLSVYCQELRTSQLFVTKGSEYITKSSFRKMWVRIYKGLLAAGADQDGLTPHVFRHNYCTNLCYQIPTISIKRIAALMGDTEKMVIEVYNHIILEKEDAATAVEAALNF